MGHSCNHARYPYVAKQSPQCYRSIWLIHEARHIDPGFLHVECPESTPDKDNPVYSQIAGQVACDDRADGSRGVEIADLKSISRFCTNCSENYREIAGTIAKHTLSSITNPAERRLLENAFFDETMGSGIGPMTYAGTRSFAP